MTNSLAQPELKKPGAQPGNLNRATHGRRIRYGLLQSRLPAGSSYIRKQRDKFRGAIEAAVASANGGNISLADAGLISSATKWETHSQLAARWLVVGTDFSPADRLAHSREVARAASERDKCLKALGLNVTSNVDDWAVLDGQITAETPAEPHEGNA